MPSYERWKFCGKCGAVATYECFCGGYHADDIQGMVHPPQESELENHPRFACEKCFDKFYDD